MGYIDTPQTQRANRRFMKSAMKIPLLDARTESELARLWRDTKDETALRRLVTPYLRLVISTASRFRSYGLPIGDLVQEGNVGLMQAAARFDPDRKVRFSTYARWWIRSSMQEFVLRNWSIVRTGTTAAQKSLFFNLRRLKARIDRSGAAYLDEDGKAEVAHKLGVSLRDVSMMEGRLSGSDKSLNSPVGETGESEWQDLLAEERPGARRNRGRIVRVLGTFAMDRQRRGGTRSARTDDYPSAAPARGRPDARGAGTQAGNQQGTRSADRARGAQEAPRLHPTSDQRSRERRFDRFLEPDRV